MNARHRPSWLALNLPGFQEVWFAASSFDAVVFGMAPGRLMTALALAWAATLPALLTLNRRLAPLPGAEPA